MKKTVLSPALTQLTRWPVVFPISVYLVREDDGLTLVDAAMPGCGKAILAEADAIGLPIKRIVLTHADSDHIGALDELRSALPDAEILMTARTAELLSGDFSQDPDEKAKGGLGRFRKTAETRPTRTINDGDLVGSLRVIASPGHSPDHIALYDTRDHTLIAGDAFQTQGGMAVSGTIRPTFPFPGIFTWHKPTALESAIRLRALNPARLVVGHGPALDDPQAAIDRAIAKAQRKLHRQVKHAS
jgi:glyoxylase-like metal-dependent hydrolase (beta-lactamase superfamily II)